MERKSSSSSPPAIDNRPSLSDFEDSKPGSLGSGEETSTTNGSWCTNLYFLPGAVGVKPHRRSTMRPATGGAIQTLQSTIHTTSPLASRYALLIFRILGFGPRLVALPLRPERFGSSFSTRIFASKSVKSDSRRSRIGRARSSREEMQK